MKATTRQSAMAQSCCGVIRRNVMSCGRNSRLIERKSAKQPEKNKAKAVSCNSGRPSATIASRRLGSLVDKFVGLAGLPTEPQCLPSVAEVSGGVRPIREPKRKAMSSEAPGKDPPALQNQLGFGSHDERSQFEHPSTRRQPHGRPPRLSQGSHEVPVRKRVR